MPTFMRAFKTNDNNIKPRLRDRVLEILTCQNMPVWYTGKAGKLEVYLLGATDFQKRRVVNIRVTKAGLS